MWTQEISGTQSPDSTEFKGDQVNFIKPQWMQKNLYSALVLRLFLKEYIQDKKYEQM